MEKKTMYIVVGVVAILLIAAVAGALVLSNNDNNNNNNQVTTITEKGSDTMLELVTSWSEGYHAYDKNVSVEVAGGGSGVGINALINNQIDVCAASRPMTASEIKSAKNNSVNPVEFKTAIDGIAIITHTGNPITTLTIEQLRGIYNGTYTNWNQVGGNDLPIVLYGRQSTSGTYAYVQEVVLLKGPYSTSMQQLQGNNQILSAVQTDTKGIGYIGIGYAKGKTGINILDLKKDASSMAFSPLNETAVLTQKYSLSRYLYLYTNGVPTGAIKDFMTWVIVTGGQTVASDMGFYALPWYDIEEGKGILGLMPPQTVTEKGSDTMLELVTSWSEQFHENKSWISVDVAGGGSGVGISALINKQIMVCAASRQMTSSEISQANTNGVHPTEFKVAIDGIAIITHTGNPITNLTIEQLRGIYNGTYTNWNQVGGPDHGIVLYGRQSTSGTYAYVQEVVLLKGAYSSSMQQLQGNNQIVAAVQTDPYGIGYVGIGYARSATGINLLELKKDSSSIAYSPLNESAVLSQMYSLSRYLYLYTDGTPTDGTWHFLNWILDAKKGQQVAVEMGFYALTSDVLSAMRAKLI
ncbi:MAG TPA: PstS family phosphate ABC transporter substrate-binding protein [Methanomassiliicoccales archaeon]|nr:PstS family phosphate ABC transporter substrate-binding protein [Methanomassiliicoccales archaeon]